MNLQSMKFVVMDLEADQLASLASSLAPMHQSNGVRDTESGYRKPRSERIDSTAVGGPYARQHSD